MGVANSLHNMAGGLSKRFQPIFRGFRGNSWRANQKTPGASENILESSSKPLEHRATTF